MKWLVLLVLVAAATPAWAAKWTVDHHKSQLGFSLQWQGQPFNAVFRRWTATIDFNPADLDHAKVSVVIDLASVTSGIADMDRKMIGAQGFDVSNYDAAEFSTTWFRATGKNSYEARGVLTLHGRTRAITLPFKLRFHGNTVHLTGHAEVMRTDFDIGMGQWSGENPVARMVKIILDITAKKTP